MKLTFSAGFRQILIRYAHLTASSTPMPTFGGRRIQPAQGGSPGGGLTATYCTPNAQVCSILPLNMFADLLASSAQHTCTFRWWVVHYIHAHASCTINKGYAHTMADLQGSAHSRDCLELWPWPSYPYLRYLGWSMLLGPRYGRIRVCGSYMYGPVMR